VIYEAHVGGFTVHSSSGVAHPGTYRGLIEEIPYLKDLGVTAAELMPVSEFNDCDARGAAMSAARPAQTLQAEKRRPNRQRDGAFRGALQKVDASWRVANQRAGVSVQAVRCRRPGSGVRLPSAKPFGLGMTLTTRGSFVLSQPTLAARYSFFPVVSDAY
jgi:hypothetical protein